ncbi:MAG: 2,3-bisphosphoglycerate-independent phosphoglycerate mutase [Planctomycetota bacterium]|nr:MAG: 2,3-bisphosphoglycerate-independent phosphoglycerate mutase [Planctomycetota bacterium]
MQAERPVLIVVRDGWGVREATEGNAVALARTPRHDDLLARYPATLVNASEHFVGLPDGQMGNSEVGHLNMGAGRTVYQDYARIERDIREGRFRSNAALLGAMQRAQERDRTLHLLGLCSDGGVHSHLTHLRELLVMAREAGVPRVAIHALTDGRDVDPYSGKDHLATVVAWTKELGVGRVATVAGRYYTMDRDRRWDRVRKGYEAMVHGRGPQAKDPVQAVLDSYANDVSDEFIVPTVIVDAEGRPLAPVRRGDQIIAFNFRADRMRQICRALADPDFADFERGPQVFELVAMTEYADDIPFRGVAYPPQEVRNHIVEYLGRAGLSTFKCAETEKYAHVTFFWNGGVEEPYPGEERLLVPSPRVATYDMQPEMSAREVADGTVARIRSHDDALLVVNFANPDMVGHTGVLEAAIEAVEAVDDAVGRCVEAVLAKGGAAIVTADHGNCETMLDPETGRVHTAHTTNPVHAVLCGKELEGRRLRPGCALASVAPTALELMGLPAPAEMTAPSLLVAK